MASHQVNDMIQSSNVVARFAIAIAFLLAGCSSGDHASRSADSGAATAAPASCAANQSGLVLPDGFCATIFADSLGHVRHLAVAPNGDVYANTWSGEYYPEGHTPGGPFLVALRDTNRDGRAEVIARFGDSLA
ncbi:MAG TPA: hypothetical protein VIB98_04345, partial [Gemmatimonadaceae bacterium]